MASRRKIRKRFCCVKRMLLCTPSIKAGKIRTKFYPKILHLICVARGFHHVAEVVVR